MTRAFHLGQHLVDVIDSCGRRNTQPLFELVVRRRGDSRLSSTTQIDRHTIGLVMLEGCQHTLSRIHSASSFFSARMNSGLVPQQPPMKLDAGVEQFTGA